MSDAPVGPERPWLQHLREGRLILQRARGTGGGIFGPATDGIGEAPGFEPIDLAAKAGLLALKQAGLSLSDVDGLFLCLPQDYLSGLALAEYLGIQPRLTDNNRTGGSAFLTHTI